MESFFQKHGRAFDISGALLFLVLGGISAFYGVYLLALYFWIGTLAFFASFRTWRAPDDVELRFNRTMCAIFSAIAAVVLFVFLVSLVLA